MNHKFARNLSSTSTVRTNSESPTTNYHALSSNPPTNHPPLTSPNRSLNHRPPAAPGVRFGAPAWAHWRRSAAPRRCSRLVGEPWVDPGRSVLGTVEMSAWFGSCGRWVALGQLRFWVVDLDFEWLILIWILKADFSMLSLFLVDFRFGWLQGEKPLDARDGGNSIAGLER